MTATQSDNIHPLRSIALQCSRNSERWFPHLHDRDVTSLNEQLKHMALGLTEEAGEVAGIVKKLTGYTAGQDAHSRYESIGHELADVIVYAFNLAAVLDVDLDRALAEKTAICEARWGSRSETGRSDEPQVGGAP